VRSRPTESGVQADSSAALKVDAAKVSLTWRYGWALMVNVGGDWPSFDAP
jgi:hypothetical protein